MKIVFANPYFEDPASDEKARHPSASKLKMKAKATSSDQKSASSNEPLIQLFPFGLSLNQDPSRPMLLLKDQTGRFSMPVFLTPIEAGVVVQQSNQSLPSTPHKVTELLLKSLQIQIEKCVFVGIKGHHQYMRLFIKGHPTMSSVKVKAQDAMSLCLNLNVPLYATEKFMNRSRVMTAEIEGISKGLELNPAIMVKTHQYLI